MLNFTVQGEGAPLLIAHGLFGSARNWGVLAKRLSDERQVITVDMRNHGASPWTDTHSYADMAGDLAEVIAAHGGKADVIGHSMGGKSAMMLALTKPELVDRLVVADIAPVAYAHTQSHLIAAMQAVDIEEINTRSDADKQLQDSVEDPTTRAFVLQSLNVKERRWMLNLEVLDREMPGIIGWPELSETSDVTALFLTGAESDYVTAEGRGVARRYFPKARFAKLSNAGHWLHSEQPRAFEETVRFFLKR